MVVSPLHGDIQYCIHIRLLFFCGPGGSRGLSHLAGSGIQPVGEIQNGLAAARQAVLEVLLADRPAGVTIGAAQVVAGAARIVLAVLLPFRGELFRGAEGGRQLAGSLRPLPGVLWIMSPAAPSATGTTATSFVRCDEQLRDVVALAVQRRTCSP